MAKPFAFEAANEVVEDCFRIPDRYGQLQGVEIERPNGPRRFC